MSASKLDTSGVFQSPTEPSVAAQFQLSPRTCHIRKSGIEFHSATPVPIWKEMTMELQGPEPSRKVQCDGVVVACEGNPQTGYQVSLVFTHLTRQAQQRLTGLASRYWA